MMLQPYKVNEMIREMIRPRFRSELNIQKKESHVKKKKRRKKKGHKISGAFLDHHGETGTKSFRSRIKATKADPSFSPADKSKFFTHSCVHTTPLPHASEQDPLAAQLR
jgi:hypothetical protein